MFAFRKSTMIKKAKEIQALIEGLKADFTIADQNADVVERYIALGKFETETVLKAERQLEEKWSETSSFEVVGFIAVSLVTLTASELFISRQKNRILWPALEAFTKETKELRERASAQQKLLLENHLVVFAQSPKYYELYELDEKFRNVFNRESARQKILENNHVILDKPKLPNPPPRPAQ